METKSHNPWEVKDIAVIPWSIGISPADRRNKFLWGAGEEREWRIRTEQQDLAFSLIFLRILLNLTVYQI